MTLDIHTKLCTHHILSHPDATLTFFKAQASSTISGSGIGDLGFYQHQCTDRILLPRQMYMFSHELPLKIHEHCSVIYPCVAGHIEQGASLRR